MTLAPRTRGAILRRIEAMSVRGLQRHWQRIPPDDAKRLRPRAERMGDGFMTMLETSDSLRMNRTMGVGHRGRAREAMIDEIVAWYRAAGLGRFSFHLSPGPQALKIRHWLLERGFRQQGGHVLLLRDCREPIRRVASAMRVVKARPVHMPAIVGILERCFGMPASRRKWALAAAKTRGYEHYLALVGTTPVGAGTCLAEGDLAWLGGGATLTRWRRRGAHSALITARLRRAARRGCRWAWVETAAPAPGRTDGSRRNLLRLGFEPIGLKPIFVWQGR